MFEQQIADLDSKTEQNFEQQLEKRESESMQVVHSEKKNETIHT